MPYVNQRWLGGMLTNFKTIRASIKRLTDLEEMTASGALEKRGKKEATQLRREMAKLETEPGRHQGDGGAAGRAVRRSTSATSTSRFTRRASSASRWSPSSTPTARPMASITSFRATTTRCAPFSCTPRPWPRQCWKARPRCRRWSSARTTSSSSTRKAIRAAEAGAPPAPGRSRRCAAASRPPRSAVARP